MRLDQFPRPQGDTGIGFRYYADTHHYDPSTLDFWIAELAELGASWLVLTSTLEAPVPEHVVRALIAARIEPIIHLDIHPIQPIDRSSFLALCRRYADWGAYYLYVYSEPNRVTSWRFEDWAAPGLPSRFAELLLPVLETTAEAGLLPLVSPLAPGGQYWDLTFLGQLLDIVTQQAAPSLVDHLGVCIHNPAGNRPLNWGKGGPTRWPSARPYQCPPGSQDHRGFYLFEWYDAIIREHLGTSHPLICAATGLVPGNQDDPDFPAVDDMTHSLRSVEIARLIMDGDVPPYLFNIAFDALAAGDAEPDDPRAWYRRDSTVLPAVQALKALKKHPRPIDGSSDGSVTHPIYHYLLIYSPTQTPGAIVWSTRWMLQATAEYVEHFQPVIGFSIEEARRASRVTIVGTDAAGMDEAEATLRAAGCLVEQIRVTSEDELRRVLGQMVRRGRRFRHLPG